MSKILIAYFSASGVTARTAKEMAKAAGADLYEICPAEPYTAADLNWMDQKSRSTLEMNDPACRPAIAAPAADLDQYDTVFVGFPIWWYVEPRIVDTFLERSDFSGKTVIPFGHLRRQRDREGGAEPEVPLSPGQLEEGQAAQPHGCGRLDQKRAGFGVLKRRGPQDTGLEQAFPIPAIRLGESCGRTPRVLFDTAMGNRYHVFEQHWDHRRGMRAGNPWKQERELPCREDQKS